MVASLACFTANALLLKHLGTHEGTSPWLALLYRAIIGMAVVQILCSTRMAAQFGAAKGSLNFRRAATSGMLVSRGVLGAFGTAAYYLTLPVLGAGKATLIGNTWVIWSALLAVFLLKEHLAKRQLVGIFVAISGLVLLTGSDAHGVRGHAFYELIAIAGALVAAVTVVVIRQLTRSESTATIFVSQCIYTALLALPFVIGSGWQVSVPQSAFLTAAATAAAVGQLAMTEGFRHLPVTTGGAFQVALPLCITLASMVIFHEAFSLGQTAGAALIILGGYQAVGRR